MKKPSSRPAVLIFLIVLLIGCKLGSEPIKSTEKPIPSTSTSTSKAPGDFNLADTAIGLDSLHSYHQSLQITFEGIINGEQQQSKITLIREVVDDPLTQLSWIEIGEQPVQFFGRIGSENYHQPSPEVTCSTFPVKDTDPQQTPATYQLASLPPVLGAEFANEDEVNGVPAKHYTFDERAIGFTGQVTAQGEIWVASTGGYVLRYTLRLDAPDGVLGPDVKGVQAWHYELSEVNTGKTSLPEICQPIQENAAVPMLDSAMVILQQPGYLVYQVTSGVDAAVAFYQQQAETLGWSGGTPFLFGEVTRLTLRPTDGSLVQLTFEPDGDMLTVTVQTLAPMPSE